MEQLDMFEVIYDELPKVTELKVGTFFSGIGSPEMALGNIGIDYDLQFFSEIDKYAIKAYCAIHNESEDKCIGSITDIKGVDLPYCDLWFGGFPCQDISLAGKGKGFTFESETRSSLGWEMIRLIREVKEKPKYIVFENVAAIFNEKHRPTLNLFKLDLEKLGYTLYNDLLNAKDYGIPQNRNRYFLVAILGKYSFKFPKKQELKLRLKDMLEDEVDEKYYLSDKGINYAFKRSAKFDREPRINSEISHCLMASELSKGATQHIELVTDNLGVVVTRDNVDKHKFVNPNVENEKNKLKSDNQNVRVEALIDRPGIIGQSSRIYNNNNNAPSLHTSSKDIMHSDKDLLRIRKLTPKECYRLMGFSDEAFERAASVVSNTQLYKTAGNSIVVNVLEEIFKKLFMLEKVEE